MYWLCVTGLSPGTRWRDLVRDSFVQRCVKFLQDIIQVAVDAGGVTEAARELNEPARSLRGTNQRGVYDNPVLRPLMFGRVETSKSSHRLFPFGVDAVGDLEPRLSILDRYPARLLQMPS